MSGALIGVFDPGTRLDGSRLPEGAVQLGPLRISSNTPPLIAGTTLCVLEGVLDNGGALAEQLGCGPLSSEGLLVAGYQRWGRGLLTRLRGDFSLLLWDEQRGEGLLARDQMGVRSVFLCDGPGGIYFASEIHNLLALLPSRPAPDPVGVAHWVAVSPRPGAGTLYSGIRRLSPGSALFMDRHRASEEPYWRPRYVEPLEATTEHELTEQVRHALAMGVGRRIDQGSPTGVLMSGGLDSASVAALAAQSAHGRVLAYSGTFPEHPAVDEAELVQELRDRFDLGGLTAQVRSGGLLASAAESLAANQLPLVAWGDFWTLPLLRGACDDGVRTIIGGDGGDELFGARAYLLADRLRSGRPTQAYALARELPGAGDRPAHRQVARVMAELALEGSLPYSLHDTARRLRVNAGTPGWLLSNTKRDLHESEDPLAWKRLDGPRWWAHLAHGLTRGVEETGVFEHQRLRAALAGVQARHPLFDLDLIELGLRLPPQASFDRHLNRPTLRAAMRGSLPDSVRLRPAKAWFDSLIVDCLTGPDRSAVSDLLASPKAELHAYADMSALKRTLLDVDPVASGDRFRWMHQVWRLVTAELWLRSQAHDPGPQAPARETHMSSAHVLLDRATVRDGGPHALAQTPLSTG